MIHKIDTQTLESINRLNTGSKDWRKLLASIKVDRDTLITKLINSNDEHDKSVYQGMLRWINKLLDHTENASKTLHIRKEKR